MNEKSGGLLACFAAARGFAFGLCVALCALLCVVCLALAGCSSGGASNASNSNNFAGFGQVSDVQVSNASAANANGAGAAAAAGAGAAANNSNASGSTAAQSSTSAYIDGFPFQLQNPEMPSGCEITSLTMVLNYLGFDCTKFELADQYLNYGSVGDDMYSRMIGSVYSDYALGCYAGAIVDCARAYAADQGVALTAEDISGSSLEDYCALVAAGHPVIVWATEGMTATWPDTMWTYNGEVTGYMHGEHCLVMVGFDKDADTVVMADPLRGEAEYSLSEFYDINQQVFAQAVLVTVP